MFSVPFAPAPLRLPFLAPTAPSTSGGVRVDTERPRRIRPRYVIALLAAFALMAALAVGVVRTPRSEAAIMVDEFASAFDQRDVAAAAALTSYPAAAAQTMNQIFDGLGPVATSSTRVSQFIGLDDTSGFFTLDSTYKFGEATPADAREWHITSQGTARKLAVGWRIAWDPAVLIPGLGKSGSVQYTRTDAKAPLVLAASGAPMMAEAAIARVDLDPSAMADPAASTQKLADVIDVVAPLITSETMLTELAAAQGGSVTAVTLRGDDYAVLEDDLRAIDGVKLYTEPALLATDRRLDSPLLDSLRTLWQQSRDATSGWAVDIANPDITDPSASEDSKTLRQAGFQGPAAPDIKSTIDPAVQLAAETAVVNAPTSASIVAIRPSTGAVVAVAQNSYANALGTPALDHLHAAGSLTDVIDGSRDMQGTDFATAAKQLGLGTTYDMPGVHAVSAALGTSARSISVTPFGLAQMSAAFANGSAPTPMIVDGSPAAVSDGGGAIPAAVLDRLRGAMRDNAAEQDLENGVIGLNGTNDADDRWFTGIKGDLAFAVYIDGADGSDQATNMAARLLSEMASPTE